MDTTGRIAGRGAYLCADGSCWATAVKKRALDRALSTRLPDELRAVLERGPNVGRGSADEAKAVSHGA